MDTPKADIACGPRPAIVMLSDWRFGRERPDRLSARSRRLASTGRAAPNRRFRRCLVSAAEAWWDLAAGRTTAGRATAGHLTPDISGARLVVAADTPACLR